LTDLRAYLAVAAYPGIVIFVFRWGGPSGRWARNHRSFFLPPDLKRKSEESGRHFLLIRLALLVVVLRGLAGADFFWHTVPIATHSRVWLVLVVSGIAGGVAMLAFRRLLSSLSAVAASAENNEYFSRGPLIVWLAVFFLGAFVEEFWRALCIVAFRENDYGALSVNLLTAFAFSVAHLSGLPSRISPGAASAGAEMIMGLALGGLFIWSGNLLTPYLASVIYFTSSFFIVRHRFH
jgi:membrane protease YdiL (CAAX protease family)